ncbi:MAG TPA: hypothetical protein VK469_05860, partial [Candidatus Kapabacteria bacterium]|nr:hypothetical protein [Candidatus Kapabacteria bacterium]
SIFIEILMDELIKNRKPWVDIAEIYRAIEWKGVERTGNHPGFGNLKNTNYDPAGSYILFAFPSLPL